MMPLVLCLSEGKRGEHSYGGAEFPPCWDRVFSGWPSVSPFAGAIDLKRISDLFVSPLWRRVLSASELFFGFWDLFFRGRPFLIFWTVSGQFAQCLFGACFGKSTQGAGQAL